MKYNEWKTKAGADRETHFHQRRRGKERVIKSITPVDFPCLSFLISEKVTSERKQMGRRDVEERRR